MALVDRGNAGPALRCTSLVHPRYAATEQAAAAATGPAYNDVSTRPGGTLASPDDVIAKRQAFSEPPALLVVFFAPQLPQV